MSTFVFVHGAWHWGGCFLKVANVLACHGHRTLMPDLTGHGYDATPPASVRDMDHYTRPVATILEQLPEPAILVGHSMGGATLTFLGERLREQIQKLVYLTAFMVPDGKAPNDYIFAEGYRNDPMARELFQIVSVVEEGVAVDLSDRAAVKQVFYGDCSDHDVALAARNVVPVTPLAPYATASRTTPGRFGSVPRVYIECLRDKTVPLSAQREMQADVPGAEVVSMDTSHSPFFSQPDRLAHVLMEHA